MRAQRAHIKILGNISRDEIDMGRIIPIHQYFRDLVLGPMWYFFSRPWLLKFNHHANTSATHHAHKMDHQPFRSPRPYTIRAVDPRWTSPPPRWSRSTRSIAHPYACPRPSGWHDQQSGSSRSAPQGPFADPEPIQLGPSTFSESAPGYYPALPPPPPFNVMCRTMFRVMTGLGPGSHYTERDEILGHLMLLRRTPYLVDMTRFHPSHPPSPPPPEVACVHNDGESLAEATARLRNLMDMFQDSSR